VQRGDALLVLRDRVDVRALLDELVTLSVKHMREKYPATT
jgi:hypothetical protein